MRWFEYKMEVDDLHASDDLKAKLLAMQSQQAVSVPAAKTVTRKQPEVPAHKKALHFPSSRVWKGLAACAAFCVVAGGAASVLHLGVIGVGGAKSSGPATFSSREATGFSMENSVSSYAMASAPAVADDTMNESSAAAGGADTGTAVLTSGELESAGESAHAAESSKIIYTANLTLESKDYDAARAALDAALAEAGGYMESSDEYANSGSRRSLSLTLRVPQENYESFLAAVAATGNVTYKSQQAEDVTTQYMDIEARLDSLKEQRARLQELKASADNLSDLLQIESSRAMCSTSWKAIRASWTGTAARWSAAPSTSRWKRCRPIPPWRRALAPASRTPCGRAGPALWRRCRARRSSWWATGRSS